MSQDASEMCDVGISYAHDDEREYGYAADLAQALKSKGLSVWYDKELMREAGTDWHTTITNRLDRCWVVAALWSKKALSRPFCDFEGKAAAKEPGKLMPFELEPLDDADFSKELYGLTYRIMRVPYKRDETVRQIKARVDEFRASRPAADNLIPAPPSAALLAQPRIDLPATLISGSGYLAGRDEEERLLLDAWASCEPDASRQTKTNIVVLYAMGGAGKTALLRRLVDLLAQNDFPHADKVLGWSAYSQGSGENRNADSDTFIINALRFMGELGELPRDAVARAHLLAARMKETRTLILLDGIEPLQSLPDVNRGRLKDKGLQRLILDLSLGHPGLLVITSRQHLPELQRGNVTKTGVRSYALDRLTQQAGAHLLHHLGCWGSMQDMESAVEEVQGHALSVTLLGTYINAVEAGDLARRDHTLGLKGVIDLPEELSTDETARLAKRAGAIMAGYIARFEELEGNSKGRGEAERLLLSIVGLFDRPADGAAVRTLLLGEPIPGLTDAYQSWTDGQRDGRLRFAKARLRDLKLLAAADEKDPDGLDAHPVVRGHFGAALREASPDTFRAAHERLYRHYTDAAPHQPETLAEMQPLFHSIGHGCAAGLLQEAFDDVFYARIFRNGGTAFSVKQLGSASATLGALAHFFDPPWATPSEGLTKPDRIVALGYAALALRAIGRLGEAEESAAASFALHVKQEDQRNAAIAASNLSELRLAIGRVAAAVEASADAVEHAEGVDDADVAILAVTTHADALAQAGHGREAAALFAGAEARQAEDLSESPRLYLGRGYRYCDLLLDQGAADEVRKRAAEMIAGEAQDSLLDRALYRLTDASALSLLAAHGDAAAASAGRARLEEAVAALRAAGDDEMLPRGLLARSHFNARAFACAGDLADLKAAAEDLSEVEDIASRGGMNLCLADWRLESAGLCLAQVRGAPLELLVRIVEGLPRPEEARHDFLQPSPGGPERTEPLTAAERDLLTTAEEHTTAAAALIGQTGYHRRDRALRNLRERLKALSNLA